MVMTALEQGRLGVPNPEGVGDGGERGAGEQYSSFFSRFFMMANQPDLILVIFFKLGEDLNNG